MNHDADIDALKRQLEAANATLAELRESEVLYRTLYSSSDEGFMEVEVVQDPDGQVVDWRYIVVNPAVERLTGIKDIAGRLVSEVMPDLEMEWAQRYSHVVNTGEPIRFELPASGLGRWFNAYLARIGPAGSLRVVVVFSDVTERKRSELALEESEARQTFLLKFSDSLRAEPTAEGIANRALQMLREHLRLDRCYIGIYRLADDAGDFPHQVHDDRLPPLPAQVRLSDFPEALQVAFDRTLVIDNVVEMEGLSDTDRASFAGLGLGALIAATLRKGENNPLWAINAISTGPRVWTQGEVALVEEVAERTWAAVERARTEAALRESERRLRAERALAQDVLDNMGDAFVLLDRDLRFLDLNIEAMRLEDRPREALIGKTHEEAHPDAAPELGALLRQAIAERRAVTLEHNFIWPDGRATWIDMRAYPFAEHLAVFYRDVTARKNTEFALRDLNAALEGRVIERTQARGRSWALSPDLMGALDQRGFFVTSNPAWLAVLGWSEDEVRRTTIWDLLHPDDLENTRGGFHLTQQGQAAINFENRYRHKDGSYRSISWVCVPDDGLVYCTGRDVTVEKKREAELEVAKEALRQTHKMEALGQLTGGVAHDFNNLLTPIVGALDLLQRRELGNDRDRRLIAGAAQSADRATTLVQRLLAFARRQPLQAVQVDVAKLVTGMADLIESTTGPQIEVKVEIGNDLPPAKADPNQLEMALLNLAVNARDAMPDGGTLWISANAEAIDQAHRSQLSAGRYLHISVADTGVGMDEATLARAVEPFFSTKGVGRGTGLGLSMVHGLASQLGGAVTIKSTPGIGTNVEMWLPQGEGDAEIEPASKKEQVKVEGVRGKVLLVDDEEPVRLSTSAMLMELGYDVIEAVSAVEALGLLEGGLAPNIVVTDHLMPGVTGTELAYTVRNAWPAIKVLVVSGYAETAGISPELPRLTKPFRTADLATSLNSLD